MKKLFVVSSIVLGISTVSAHASDWRNDVDAAVKRNDFNAINVIGASHPEAQGAIAVYLMQQSQASTNDPQREVQLFKAAAPFVGRVSPQEAASVSSEIDGAIKVAADPTFKKGHPREATDIYLSALPMSSQPNIAAVTPGLHAEVLQAAADFIKADPQDADKRLLEQVSAADGGGSQETASGAINVSPAYTTAALGSNAWKGDIDAAVQSSNYNKINIVAASHPEAQGAIAIYLLQLAQAEKGNPQRQVEIFKTATPFVGRIPAKNAAEADEIITGMLKLAADPTFKKGHPREAGAILLSALLMSNQPNIVADDPNLHSEVLEAADEFVKEHPEDADKRLLEQVSLAEAGGAPETPPRGVINPSAE